MNHSHHLFNRVFQQALPGQQAQQVMAARPASGARWKAQPNAQTREGSVLICLYQRGRDWFFPLIQRPEYGGTHSGQVALPGGRREAIDTDLRDTALRETREEIGLPEAELEIVGQLSSLFVFASNFMVHPYVGICKGEAPQFVLEEREVAEVLETAVEEFLQVPIEEKTLHVRGYEILAPHFPLHQRPVWGATAMILNEFRVLMEKQGGADLIKT